MKKNTFTIIAILTVFLGVSAISLFLIFTNQNNDIINNAILDGSWRVLEYNKQKTNDEFIIFTSENFAFYHNQENEPYLQGTYKYDNNEIILSEYNKKYNIVKLSNNNIKLIESSSNFEWNLLRCSLDGTADKIINNEMLIGDWNVIMHAGSPRNNEILNFTEESLRDYQNGEIYLESNYTWNDTNMLYIDEANLSLEVYVINNNTLAMVETESGYIWELEKGSDS